MLEQHYQVGGFCSSFKRKGFVFNTGVSDVSGLWENGPVARLLKELDLDRDEFFVKNTIRYIFRGQEIEARSLEEFEGRLASLFPEEKENLSAFFTEARQAYEECYREADLYGTPLPAELIVRVLGEKALLDYPKEHPHFYDWMNRTFRQKLDEHFRSEELKRLLCALTGYVGADAEKIPASSALTAVVSYYLYGGYFPRGGARKFADALKSTIEKCGGTVLLRHRVEKILVEGGKVRGVKAAGKTFRVPIVVANANARTTFLELVGREHLEPEFLSYIESLKMSPSAFAVFVGVDADLEGYPSIIVDLDDGFYATVNSSADPSLAPEGKASLTLLKLAYARDFPERGTEEYKRIKWELAGDLVRKAEKVFPDLSRKIVVQDAATPRTFERYTSMPEGAIYAFDQSTETRRPYFKTPIRGLYLASASTFPGGGVEAVVIAGTICANDICGWAR